MEMRKVRSPKSVRIPFIKRGLSHKEAHSRGAQTVISEARTGVWSER